MLKKLTIQNYALIDSLDIEFPDGLVIITGETGAGKSILLGALSLLLGAKAEPDVLKDKDRNCVVEGEFELKNLPQTVLRRLEEGGVELERGELCLRRVISPNGRSRSFINDAPVAVGMLTEISGRLIDIHAQHQHLLLTDENYQLSVLDYFAGTEKLLQSYRDAYQAYAVAKSNLARLDDTIAARNQELDYKQFQFDKLEEAKLAGGELEELELEQKQLANAEEIKNLTCGALELLQPMGVSIVQNLKDASNLLRKCSNFVPGLEPLAQRLESCRIECKDIEAELNGAAENITVSPQRLEYVEGRLGVIYSFCKKYDVSTVGALLEIKNTLEQELLQVSDNLQQRERLAKEVLLLEEGRKQAAVALSEKRKEKIAALSQVLENKIKELEMPHAVFGIEHEIREGYAPEGIDKIRFVFSANGAQRLLPVQKAASGGELSRIMLCIKSLMAEYIGMATMIFDEIDTGVSGSIADKMGNLIGQLGNHMQLFAITHLPQIAAKGETHLLVYKEFDGRQVAATRIKALDKQERVMEVARMLSGAELSKAAIENAKFLLKK